jgi:transcriptional regulator GlxA family with amidase domain
MAQEPITGRTFLVLVADGFSALGFSAVVRAIDMTNEVIGKKVYACEIISSDGGIVVSDTHTQVNARKGTPGEGQSRQLRSGDFNVLLSGTDDQIVRQRIINGIRDGLSRGAKVLSVGAATTLLAEAGLLGDRRCSVHWRDFGLSIERFPSVLFTRAFYEIDGPFHTCAGEMSVFDLMLRIVELDFGREVAESVASEIQSGSMRGATDRQKPPTHLKLERMGSPILRVVDLMEDNLSEAVDIKTLIEDTSISRRQIERLFEKEMGTSPKRYYLRLRLDRARELLRHSSLPIVEIAVATGFVSASHFSKTFKTTYGYSPTELRRSVPTAPSARDWPNSNDNSQSGEVDNDISVSVRWRLR